MRWLPALILRKIAIFSDLQTVGRLHMVCKKYNKLLEADSFYKEWLVNHPLLLLSWNVLRLHNPFFTRQTGSRIRSWNNIVKKMTMNTIYKIAITAYSGVLYDSNADSEMMEIFDNWHLHLTFNVGEFNNITQKFYLRPKTVEISLSSPKKQITDKQRQRRGASGITYIFDDINEKFNLRDLVFECGRNPNIKRMTTIKLLTYNSGQLYKHNYTYVPLEHMLEFEGFEFYCLAGYFGDLTPGRSYHFKCYMK